ncbi:hypothetical protein QBC38DRAFT_481446 [Podospora fimiseda]|uniref:RRM domain-containing protein n=1 Tax=Podospora fimiseda TaxID=252190 RepID=A0AAN7BMK1_9PEZI|nr:hypothetical protein QBC38DRAFT_481446 [Podospora fimiseda]
MAANGNKKVAADFEKIINEGRDRKKNEDLAAKIFARRSSAPGGSNNNGKNKLTGAGSLASRAGVKKTQPTSSSSRFRQSTGNVNGEWTHDLHDSSFQPPKEPKAGSLASRITDPSAPVQIPTGPRQKRRAAQVAQALIRTELQQHQRSHAPPNAPTGPAASISQFNKGITIRGLAGPYVVMAQNFAPGTTAADIESAMTPVGGIVTQCRVVKNHPIVIAEIVFESREGAEAVIKTFNGQTADGRVLSVYHKPGNTPAAPLSIASSSRSVSEQIVDGTYGFDEPMTVDSNDRQQSSFSGNGNTSGGNGKVPPIGPSALYSDGMIGSGNQRRARYPQGYRGRGPR